MSALFEGGTPSPYQLTIDGLASDAYRVESFRGTEAISDAYSFEVVAIPRSVGDEDVEASTLGQRAILTWNVGNSQRAFYGVVAAVRVARREGQQAYRHHYRVVPRLWLLKRKRRSRIFQKMRVPDVVSKVLLDAGIATRWQLGRAYPVREYVTQYEESDYRFVTRLLAEAGIYFYFAEGPPVDDATEVASEVVGAAGSIGSSIVGSVAGSAAGAVVSDVAGAASPLIPGDTVIFGDDACFYPALGKDDAAALEAATAAAMAPEAAAAVGGALGGLGAAGGAVVGAASAVVGDVIGAVTSQTAPPLYYLDAVGTSVSRLDKILAFDLGTSVRANQGTFRDYDPLRPMAKLESVALSNDPFPSDALEQAAGVATAAGSAVGQFAPGPVGAVGSAVAENAGAVASAVDGVIGGSAPPLLEVYDHHGVFLFPQWSFANDEGPKILRQKRRRAMIGRGVSGSPDLGAGHRFALTGHPVARLDQPYVVVSVEHLGNDRFSPSADADAAIVYENRFECAPATMTYVPPRPKRKSVQVSLTATVVGPKGTEIHVDPMGQIKVQFHWDRDGSYDDKSSCWIRTMHPWGGPGWGVQFIPRVGMEVVVVFEGGDPDKPMVLGSLYNGTHPPPFLLPKDKTRSGFRTQTSPGGSGYNELSFEDAAGGEQIHLHAQRDLDEVVRNDHKLSVGKNQDIGVGENRALSVSGSSVEKVAGDATIAVAGNREITVAGAQVTRVAHDLAISTDERHTLKAGVSSNVVVGTKEAEGTATLDVYGDVAASSTNALQITAAKSIRLVCGKSLIEITPDEIRIESTALTLVGTSSVSAIGKGPALHLTDEAKLSAKSITIKTAKGQLKLDSDASITGDTIKLNCDDVPSDDDDAAPPAPPQNFKIALKDDYGQPFADKAYTLTVEGQVYDGTTDGGGLVTESVSPTALSGDLVLWLDQKGQGPRLRFPITIGEMPPLETPFGVRTRLKNLGYLHGASQRDGDADTSAIKAFQRDQGLDVTGELDGATKAKLGEAHGN